MTLFTAEGLLRGWVRRKLVGTTQQTDVVAHAYARWAQTQGETTRCDVRASAQSPGWLVQHKQLHNRRAPGLTCLGALQAMSRFGAAAHNDSKGCGGVMRVAPVGLYVWRLGADAALRDAFDLGRACAALTHGHPTGSLSGGAMAAIVVGLLDGASLDCAVTAAKSLLAQAADHAETLDALNAAQRLAASAMPPHDAIAALGQGWTAEEAMAIGVYCALVARDFAHGVTLAVNHDGDSDSTGSIAGNLLGAMYGVQSIPERWLAPLELRKVIAEVASDLYAFANWDIDTNRPQDAATQRLLRKYPGS